MNEERKAFEQERDRTTALIVSLQRELQRRLLENQSDKRDVVILQGRVAQLKGDLQAETARREQQEAVAAQLRVELGAARRNADRHETRAKQAEATAAKAEASRARWEARTRLAEASSANAEAALSRRVLLEIKSDELLANLVSLNAANLREVMGTQAVTCGCGPWEVDVLDSAVSVAGFEPHFLDKAAHEIAVFVVGRRSVDLDLLRTQLDERVARREPVWIFSQELFVLSLIAGEDLLAGERLSKKLLIEEFARDHPILETFLSGEDWTWPNPEHRGRGGTMEIEVGTSPLSSIGYRVGQHGKRPSERQQLLLAFLEERELGPYFMTEHNEDYRRSWGKARSGQRLTRMVKHLQWLVATQGQDASKHLAKSEWQQDLRWIRKRCV